MAPSPFPLSPYPLHLEKSFPEKDSSVESPSEIRLWFNQVPELSVSRIELKHGTQAMKVGKVAATDDPKSFTVEVLESLADGAYTVAWRTAGDDGHVERGTFDFSVANTRGER